MDINLELYKIFYAVAQSKNITKASKELNISQPAISKHIKNLEENLGGKLFVRTKRGVNLTKGGEELYKYVKEALEYIKNAENKFSELVNLETGTIRIGVSTTLAKHFLLPYIKSFHKKYPGIHIDINTNLWADLIPKLRNGLIDMIVLNITDIDYDKDLNIIKCKKIEDCFISSKDYYKNIKDELSIKNLNKYPLIIQMKRSSARTSLDNLCSKYDVVLKPQMELSSYTLVVELTKMSLGIGYATKEYIKEEIKNKELYEIKLKEKIPPRYIGIAISKNNTPSSAVKKMIEIITKN